MFDGKATVVYIPCESEYHVIPETEQVEIAVCKVKAEKKFTPFVIKPDEVTVNQRGKDTWKREVNDIITDNVDGRVHRASNGYWRNL